MHLMPRNPVVRNENRQRVENSDFWIWRYGVVVFGSWDLSEIRGSVGELRTEHGPAEVQSQISPCWFPTPTFSRLAHFRQQFQHLGKYQWPVWTQLSNKLLVSVPVRKTHFSIGVYFPQQSHWKIPTWLLNLLGTHSLNSACLGSCQQDAGSSAGKWSQASNSTYIPWYWQFQVVQWEHVEILVF